MFKRIMASILLGLMLIMGSTFSHAAPITITTKENVTMDLSKYEILTPEKALYSTENKNLQLNGKAPSGSEVKIEVFGTTDLTKRNFNLTKLPSEKDYIQVTNEVISSGNMGFFQKQIELVMGINKIIIDFGLEDVNPVEIIIYVYDKSVAQGAINNTREVRISNLIPLLSK